MMKSPGGTTTMSGQAAHSLNTSSGFTARSSCPSNGFAERKLISTGCGTGEQAPSGSAPCAIASDVKMQNSDVAMVAQLVQDIMTPPFLCFSRHLDWKI